jgi:Swt1-like HEPN
VSSEQQRIGIALDALATGLLPFFEQELVAAYGDNWQATARSSLRGPSTGSSPIGQWDAHAILTVMWDQWNSVFRNKLGLAERSLVGELREFRNRWAHQSSFTDDDSYRVLDSAQRLLNAVGARDEALIIEDHKIDVLRNILGRRVNDEVARSRFNRARMVDVLLYSISCIAILTTMILLFGKTAVLPTLVLLGFTVFVFCFFIYKRVTAETPVYGVHECPKCSKVIYSEVCPYCDPPNRSSSIIANSSSLRFPPFADKPVRVKS